MYQTPITIQKSKLAGNLARGLRYLFSPGAGSFPAGLIGHITDPGALDLRFYDSDGTTELRREIAKFDSVNGYLQAWVLTPPALGPSADRLIYARYGGATKASDGGIWTALDPRGVYHLENVGTDSGLHHQDLTPSIAAWIDSVINRGFRNYYGSVLTRSSDALQCISGGFTLSSWLHSLRLPSFNYNYLLGKGTNYTLAIVTHDGNFGISVNGLTPSSLQSIAGLGGPGTIHHVAAVFDEDAHTLTLYHNGALDISIEVTGVPVISGDDFRVGSTDSYPQATFDEVRVFGTPLSAAEIATEYANQKSPVDFSICGSESPYSPPAGNGALLFFLNH